MYVCQLCNHYASFSYDCVLRHIGSVHSHDSGFRVQCGFDLCPRIFTNYHAFRRHLRNKHGYSLKTYTDPTVSEEQLEERNTTSITGAEGEPENPDSEYSHESQHGRQSEKRSDACHSNAMYILKLKEKHKLAQTTVDDILGDTEEVAERVVSKLQQRLLATMSEAGVNATDIPGFVEVFSASDILRPFNGLSTEYLQDKYFRENMGLVEPLEITLDSGDKFYYIPVLKSLERLLNDEFILAEIHHNHERSDHLLNDFCDGELYRKHPLFSVDKQALQLLFYNDDIEICNPLGSRAKIHKMSMFYYILGNIRPRYRSQLKAIQLIAVVNTSIVDSNGIDTVLTPLVDDIKKLEQGIQFTVDEQQRKFRGTIALTSADNLASQLLGGYKQLSSALRRCRYCMAHRDDMNTQFTPTAFQPRTRATHARHVTNLSDPLLAAPVATTYGLSRDSILNSLHYFHVTEGLPPDVMHDILEGVLQYEVKEMLRQFTGDSIFSLDTLNTLVGEFPYHYSDARNKPACIALHSKDNKVNQEADQMWCLARLLPLMIGNIIPIDNENWLNFLTLLTIMDYVFAPVVSPDIVAFLHEKIRSHHERFQQLYPECSIIPKLHYMIHIPEWILKIGPLGRHWCMRYEAKHSYFKRLAKNAYNFKNIAKTLAKRHQRLMCYYLNSPGEGHGFLDVATSTGRATLLRDVDTLQCLQDHLPQESSFYNLSRLEVNSISYKKGAIVVLAAEDDDLPVFGEIKNVVAVNVDHYYFVVVILYTICFRPHFHAYEVEHPSSPEYAVIQPTELVDYHPLGLYSCTHSGQCLQLVSLKYHVVST